MDAEGFDALARLTKDDFEAAQAAAANAARDGDEEGLKWALIAQQGAAIRGLGLALSPTLDDVETLIGVVERLMVLVSGTNTEGEAVDGDGGIEGELDAIRGDVAKVRADVTANREGPLKQFLQSMAVAGGTAVGTGGATVLGKMSGLIP